MGSNLTLTFSGGIHFILRNYLEEVIIFTKNKTNSISIFLVLTLIFSTTQAGSLFVNNSIDDSTTKAYADVISPKKQLKLGISSDKVICKTELVKAIRTNNASPICVKPSSVTDMIKTKIVHPVDSDLIKKSQKAEKIGTVKKIAVLEQVKTPSKLQTQKNVIGYNLVFETCAKDSKIKSPTVLVASDSEVKNVKLAKDINKNSCYTSSVPIKAANKDSISATLVNEGKITAKLDSLEKTVLDLSEKLKEEKQNLANYNTSQIKFDSKSQTISQKITDIRKDLYKAREELNRYKFALQTPESSKVEKPTPLSFSGKLLKGSETNLKYIKKQLSSKSKPFSYNVIFEACAGKDDIRIPIVNLSSDLETREILIAERMPAKSCQINTGVIKAENTASIAVTLTDTKESAKKITALEENIAEMQKSLEETAKQLSELVQSSKKPSDYKLRVDDLTQKIADLRFKINEAKSQMYWYTFKGYQ